MGGRYHPYNEYKDSCIEWVGEIPIGWDANRFKYLASIVTDKAISKTNPVGLENISSWSGKFIPSDSEFQGDGVAFQPGDLLFGKLRPYLAKVYLSNSGGEAVGDFHVFRPKNIVGRYLQYLMLTKEYISIVDGSTYGAKMPRASWEFMSDLGIPCPSGDEQQTISNFLDHETAKIDTLIDKQQQLIKLLKEKRQAVISHAVTKGLNPDALMKDSGVEWLGEVPEHWGRTPLKHLAIIKYGIGEPPKYVDDGVPLVRATNIRSGSISDVNLVYVNPDDIPANRIVWLEVGDIIVVRSGAGTGDSSIIPKEYEGCIAGFDMVVKPTHCVPSFLGHALLSNYVRNNQIDLEKTRAAQPHLNAEELGECFILLPSEQEQVDICQYIERKLAKFDCIIEQAEGAVKLLYERRTALISAAVTGKIDVRNWQSAQTQPPMEASA